MNPESLEALGLTLRPTDGGNLEADLSLSASLVNPVNQRIINKVTFAPVGDRLMIIDPPDLVGLAPISVQNMKRGAEVEEQLAASFDESIFMLQRRSEELQALGLSPRVNMETLQLSTEVQADVCLFTLVADRRGNFRVSSATREGEPVKAEVGQAFDISEFRERQALAGYLLALIEAPAERRVPSAPLEATAAPAVLFGELVTHFGAGARVPPRSPVEVLISLEARAERYRFAAARVVGRTFRGLLAGPKGKVWADRFELETFEGVPALLARELGLTASEVRVLAPEEE